MRLLITGVDDHGRSCVVEDRVPDSVPFESNGITVLMAAKTESCPPPPRPSGSRGDHVGEGGIPGTVGWSFIDFPAQAKTAVHHTDSLDFDVVLEGSIELVLDDGAHRLGPGDGVVINGVDHGWQTADLACRMSVVVIATPPPE
jgi:mannose-6-phosphate isomerase-like protein (cupin superfamily)